jgi:hypothetical protein
VWGGAATATATAAAVRTTARHRRRIRVQTRRIRTQAGRAAAAARASANGRTWRTSGERGGKAERAPEGERRAAARGLRQCWRRDDDTTRPEQASARLDRLPPSVRAPDREVLSCAEPLMASETAQPAPSPGRRCWRSHEANPCCRRTRSREPRREPSLQSRSRPCPWSPRSSHRGAPPRWGGACTACRACVGWERAWSALSCARDGASRASIGGVKQSGTERRRRCSWRSPSHWRRRRSDRAAVWAWVYSDVWHRALSHRAPP